jgi:uncharacterized protein DUF6228
MPNSSGAWPDSRSLAKAGITPDTEVGRLARISVHHSNRRRTRLRRGHARPRPRACSGRCGSVVGDAPPDPGRAARNCSRRATSSARLSWYSREALHLDSYFAGLAKQWRGWKGDKEWEALGLRLAARHDGLGHVTLDVTLEEDYALADRWRVRASLTVDAGALDRLAVEARQLDVQ